MTHEIMNSVAPIASLAEKQIELLVSVKPRDLLLQADSHLMEQVLINLVLNAVHAVEERPHRRFSYNGTGIPADLLDSILFRFLPPTKAVRALG